MDDFKKLTDLLTGPFSQARVAEVLGVELQHFRQMRMDPSKSGHRPPPANWRDTLAPLAAQVRDDLDPFARP